MVSSFLIPVPFALVMLYALFVPNGKNRHVGYLGALAGIATILITCVATPAALPWFTAAGLVVNLSTLLDPLSKTMALIVAGVGTFVFLYSVGYFKKGEDLRRYYFLLALFAWSMLGLVIAGNLFQLFFCWELVGVSSFLLIGFWKEKPEAKIAARKAFLTIITGDIFFFAGIFLLAWQYATLDIPTILGQLHLSTPTILAGIGILIGAMSKSAQFPLHDWLPDAMAGPTPVSAFLHSATMVKAGLFVIVRFLPLLVLAGLAPWMMAVAILTILLSGLSALVENDIKRVLAYSTINQLGFIMLALSIGAVAAGMFHLVTHSAFKALLFFIAGIIIHKAGTQDLRKISLKWSWRFLPIATLIGVLALAGVAPLSGFFSKEAIFHEMLKAPWEIIVVFSVAMLLSAMYIFRWFFTMFSKRGKKLSSPWQMVLPLPFLALFALFGGLVGPVVFDMFEGHLSSPVSILALASLLIVGLGVFIAYKGFGSFSTSALARLAQRGFLFDTFYTIVAQTFMVLARIASWIDNGIINRSVRFVGLLARALSRGFRKMQTGQLHTYLSLLIIGFLALAVMVVMLQ